jgi:hypothetical protein
MKTELSYRIWDRNTRWSEFLETIQEFVRQRGYDSSGIIRTNYIQQNTNKTISSMESLEEYIQVLRKIKDFEYFYIEVIFLSNQKKEKEDKPQRIALYLNIGANISIGIESSDYDLINGIHNQIRDEFNFRNPTLTKPERPLYLQPTIFVGRHFDEQGEKSFIVLSQFLSLLGFDVSQGEPYASIDIPNKVRERIDRQDIFIALVTGKRDHSWLNAEPAYAKGKGKHIILLVEDDSSYDPTILGQDLEQIRFPPNSIEKSFTPRLVELRNIRVKGL